MIDLAIELFFYFAILMALGMFAVFLLCMYLREFPKLKHSSKADLKNNIYKTTTEVDKATKEVDEKSAEYVEELTDVNGDKK